MQLKHELTKEQEGPKYDVFVRVLRGLSNSKLAKPGKFRTADGLGYALRCSYKVGAEPALCFTSVSSSDVNSDSHLPLNCLSLAEAAVQLPSMR